VPASHLGKADGFALLERPVQGVEGRSVRVIKEDGRSTRVPSSKVHGHLGVLVLSIGDLATEETLLGPLTRSVLQYFRLLLPDDQVRRERVRTITELTEVWKKNHSVASHVVVIGHASSDALWFIDAGWMSAKALRSVFEQPGVKAKEFLSLACSTGRASFGRSFSRSSACSAFIAPFQVVHGAIASQYCQMFFTARFLGGHSTKVAYRSAAAGLAVGAHFRLWRDGKFERSGT
jgi:hypothetical protein